MLYKFRKEEEHMRKIIISLFVVFAVLAFSIPSGAKSNTISLTGTYGSTIFGLEYETRFNFGIGLETGFFLGAHPTATPFAMKINGLLRYYFNLSPTFKPYISLGPGVWMVFPIAPEALPPISYFDMHATAGLEFTPGNFRIAAELGYEFFVFPSVAAGFAGWFFLKGAAGYRF